MAQVDIFPQESEILGIANIIADLKRRSSHIGRRHLNLAAMTSAICRCLGVNWSHAQAAVEITVEHQLVTWTVKKASLIVCLADKVVSGSGCDRVIGSREEMLDVVFAPKTMGVQTSGEAALLLTQQVLQARTSVVERLATGDTADDEIIATEPASQIIPTTCHKILGTRLPLPQAVSPKVRITPGS